MSKVFSSSSHDNTIVRKDHTTWCLMFRESAQNQEFEAFKSSQTNLAAFTIMFTLFTGIFFFFVYIVVHQHTKSDLVWPMLTALIVTGLVGIASISLKAINSIYKHSKLHRTTAISNYLDSIFVFGSSATICFFILNKVNNGACSDINGGFIETLCCVAERPHQMPEALMIVAAMQPAIISTVAKGAKWSVILLTFCFVMIMMFFTIFHYDLTESAMTLLIFAPFSFLILYEKQRQSISLFLLTQSQKNLLEENERLAAETHANELRHMIGNVAHDLKTPLSAFINGVDLIMGILDEISSIQESKSSCHSSHSTSLKAMLDTVKETVINMKNVNEFMLMTINRCIDYTKASNGLKLVPRLETVSLAETINLPLGCMRNMDNRIAIKMSPISEDVASHIITDKQWLQENILCLLSNAVKYSAGGEVNVSVSLSADVKFLVLEVEDTGIGIEKEVRANLFNQFKQAQRLAGGTGLGLYSLAKRVESLGGTYGVSTRKDGKQGSLFWYTIPYRPDLSATVATILLPALQGTQIPNAALKADELSTSERTGSRRLKKTFMHSMSEPNPYRLLGTAEVSMANTPTQITPREGSKKLNILLVDDSLSIIKMSSMMLRRQGHTVTTADNGAVALRILTEQMMAQNNNNYNSSSNSSGSVLFDVVLMDLQMPIMDGLEATSRLRKEESFINSSSGRSYHQRVIGVSACSDFETMEAAFAAGIDEFIPKPFNIQSFNDTYGKLQNREQLLVGTS